MKKIAGWGVAFCIASAGLSLASCKKAGSQAQPKAASSLNERSPNESHGAHPEGQLAHGAIQLKAASGLLDVSVLETGTIRLRFRKNAQAHVPPSFALDPAYVPTLPPYRVKKAAKSTTISTKEMSVTIETQPLTITQRDAKGNTVMRQEAQRLWEIQQPGAETGPQLRFSLDENERVYGLGDKAKGHDRRGHSFEMWNTDAFGWKVDQDPLYKSFPVFVFMDGSESHGLFIDTPTRAQVDVGKSRREWLEYTVAQGEAVDVYLLAGPHPKQVIERNTQITGRTPLPPYWSLGFHMSRYGYLSEAEVRGVVRRFKENKIPLDAIWLDIDFQDQNAPFTVNRKAFPHFEKMVADFAAEGVRTVAITDLHIKSYQGQGLPSGYLPFDEGSAGDHFIRSPSGEGYFEGEVWPGKSVFPEFTRAKTRAFWGDLYAEFVAAKVAGFWNDMNEPALFNVPEKTMPETLHHRLDDGTTVEHQVIHNALGALNVRATFEGVRRLAPNDRPFTLTRAAYSGAQRYSASWTGDNLATYEHLKATIPNLTNLGVSGYHFVGADVGGFEGCPSAELLASWMELGAFQPFYRNHSNKGSCKREPWVFGELMTERMKRAVERRQRFLPYIYSVFDEAARTGVPMMRPLWLEYPEDSTLQDTDTLFLVGEDLLVAPRLREDDAAYEITLPQEGFYDMQTGELYPSGGELLVQSPLYDSLRLYARRGAILPLGPQAENHRAQLTIAVFPGEDCRGTLYWDDGTSLAYQHGQWRRWEMTCDVSEGKISIDVAQSSPVASGSFSTWWKEVNLVVYGVPTAPTSLVHSEIGRLFANHDRAVGTASATFVNAGSGFSVTLSR
jgi:alpha-glucosidase